MKKFRKITYVILILIIIVLSFTIYTNANKDNSKNEGDKTISEIKFIESKLVDLLNKMNGIETRNYKISSGETTSKTSEETSNQGSSNSSDSSQNKMKEETGEETSQGNQNSDTSSGSNQKTEKIFELKKSGILANSNQIDWEDIKLDIENMYVSIPTMTIDLYSINVNQEDILAFNKEYDNLILVSKDEDKTKTVQQLSKLYEYIPKFINNTSSSTIEKKKIQTKSDIFKAYSKLDSDNWNDIYNDINNAVTNFSELLTDTNIDSEKQYSINKVYILLNELKNAVPLKDKELFLIKYKNLIERIDTL